MKSILSFLTFLLLTTLAFAQVPQAFNYQAVARDANGDCISEQEISIQITILDSVITGPIIYTEIHSVETNLQGLFSLEIGRGQVQAGTFNELADIPWGNNPKFLQVGIDPNNGINFQPLGVSELLSVPYAIQAGNEPFFNSGWFPMSSQDGPDSFKEVAHNLGVYPSRVAVQVRAIDGNNAGFIFEGMGGAQADDDGTAADEYGGVVYAYNENLVRIWAPDQNNSLQTGRIIFIGDGWGGEVNTQSSQDAEVRVLVWR